MKSDKKTAHKSAESTSIQGRFSVVKRAVLFSLLIAAILVLILIRGQMLVVRTCFVPVHPEDMPSTGFRIAALTDLHGRMIGENQGKIVGRVREIQIEGGGIEDSVYYTCKTARSYSTGILCGRKS